MTTLGSRVKAVIVHNKTTMTNFAKELNISQSMVSKICSDKATPSDRTISDICRIYSINKDWLVNGVGVMIDPKDRESEILAHMEHTAADTTEMFRQTLASILARSSPLDIDGLNDLADMLLAEYKKAAPNKPDSSRLLEMAYLEGVRAGKRIGEMMNNLPTDCEE